MKRSIIASLVMFVWLSTGAALGQQECESSIIGTWKAVTPGAAEVLYRFSQDGVLTVLSTSGSPSEPTEIASATYEVDDPKAPKSIALTTIKKNRVFLLGKSAMRIIEYENSSLTCELPGWGPTRWVRFDPNRYFIVLSARDGEFYDRSGSAFPALIKISGNESHIDAVGTYSNAGRRAFGAVPPETYKDYMREPQNESEVMLRLEINAAQYERGLKVLRTWDRRVRERALLYPVGSPLNNVLLVKAVTESLDQCGEADIKLHKLTYLLPEDWITEKYGPAFIPFAFFKELRRLNEPLHVREDKFPQVSLAAGSQKGK